MVYAIVLPLAVLIGWMAVDLSMLDRTSFATISAVIFVLLLPVILKWHYPVMILSWNTAMTVFFLPGKPALWMLLVGINFGIAILNRIIQKRPAFHSAPAITMSLLALAAVVVVTAKLRGGMGVNVLGASTIGGKGYYFIIAGILGYFALASQSIPREHARRYVAMFFLPGLIPALSHLIYYAGPAFYVLYLIFPMGFAAVEVSSEASGLVRVGGFSVAACSLSYFMMAMYGIRGLLQKWWRVLLLAVALGLGMMGGYRSMLVMIGLIILILFVLEGMVRSGWFPAAILAAVLGFAILAATATKLPRSVQRTLSLLPIEVDPGVRRDAGASVEWRLKMWRTLVPELPNYFWIGKGYAINPTDLYLVEQAARRGRATAQSAPLVAGDYHSGPLSVYVPFGAGGSLAFLAFVFLGLRALYRNYCYGAEELRGLNRFLFAYFAARLIFFLGVFGGFAADMYQFTGVLGLSVALNHGVCRKPTPAEQRVPFRKSVGGSSALPEPA